MAPVEFAAKCLEQGSKLKTQNWTVTYFSTHKTSIPAKNHFFLPPPVIRNKKSALVCGKKSVFVSAPIKHFFGHFFVVFCAFFAFSCLKKHIL